MPTHLALATLIAIIFVYMGHAESEARTLYFGPPPQPDSNNPDDRHWIKQVMEEIRQRCPEGRQTPQDPPLHKVLFCEYTRFFITCDNNRTIDVKWALYGREDGVPNCRNDYVWTCGDETASTQTVREACQGERSCSFIVTNQYFGGDPCRYVLKYVIVHYVCLPPIE